MKILWSSNAPHVTSGYGVQSNHVVKGLQGQGHELALAPNCGLQGGAVEIGGMRVYPSWRDKVGQDVLAAHAKHFGADLVVTLYDLWPYDVDLAARLKRPWAAWFPQDSYPACTSVVERAKQCDYPIAMSKFGVESMKEQGVECHYIPHGCSTDVYKPLDKSEVRKELNIAEKFTVLMVAMNQSFPSRKAFPEALAAFAQFHKAYPDSQLLLYTTRMPRGIAWDGVELELLVQSLGIKDCTRFMDEYTLVLGLPDTEMAKYYNAADVLLSPSCGEGFGVPIIEAQSCGTPVITNNFSSMPELTINGISCKPSQMHWTAINTWMATPHIGRVAEALETIYNRTETETKQQAVWGRAVIERDYSWPVIMEHWRKFLELVQHGEAPDQERLYHHVINGIDVDVFDDKLSFTTGCVASELQADRYHIEEIDFQPGDIILDIGAHVGTFAIYCAKRWPGVQVYSFEPSQTNYDRFIRSLQNAGGAPLIAIKQAGITSDGREINIALDRSNTGGTTEFVKPNGHLRETAESMTLDQAVAAIGGRIKLLKIDCEGAEFEILQNAQCLDQIEYLSGEFHINTELEAKGYSIPALYKYLTGHIPAERITYTSCRMAD